MEKVPGELTCDKGELSTKLLKVLKLYLPIFPFREGGEASVLDPQNTGS